MIALTGCLYRHKKTGGIYVVIAQGQNEADLTEVVIYQSVHDGKVWVRPDADFCDGRFEDMGTLTVRPT